MSAARQVGTLRIRTDKVFRQHSEYAAWWTDIRVPAGVYPILSRPENKEWVGAALPGVITDEANAPHLGGVAVGPDRKDRAGKPATYHWSIRAYELAKIILEGNDPDLRLEKGVSAHRVEFTGFDGKVHHTWELRFPGDPAK
jgi:hypothetical protein